MIGMYHIITGGELIQLFQRKGDLSRTGFITLQIIFMETVEQLVIGKQTKFQGIVCKPFMQSPLHSRKLNPVSPILKNGFDTIRLFRTVTTDIKCISPVQILFERLRHQIEILMKNRLCRSMKCQGSIRCAGRLVTKLHPPEIERTNSELTPIDQFSFQSNASILFGLLRSKSLRCERFIVNNLNTLPQPKEITHRQSGIFRDKIKKRSCNLSGYGKIGHNHNTLFLLFRQL